MSPALLLYQRRSNKRETALASMARPNCERQYPAGKANNGNQHKHSPTNAEMQESSFEGSSMLTLPPFVHM
jgi:hypothetical protein